MRWPGLVLALVGGFFLQARAQVLDLATVTIPGPRTLHGVYKFFVEGNHKASVNFEDLRIVPDESPIAPPASSWVTYNGLHVVVMEEKQFHKSVDLTDFCGWQDEFSVSFGAYANMTVRDAKGSRNFRLDTTGTHLAVIVNCGKLNGLAIRGIVAVRHDWGYLSPIERGSGAEHVAALVFYLPALIVWSAACYRMWSGLLNMHKGILVVLLLGVLESALWIGVYQAKNGVGTTPETVFFTAVLSSIYKLVVFFFSLTSSPSQHAKDTGSSMTFHLLCLTYMLFSFNFQTVESLRHHFDVHQSVVFLGGAPLLAIGGVVFFLSNQHLQHILAILQHETDDRPTMYRKLKGWVQIFSGLALILLLMRIFDPSATSTSMWWLHSYLSNGFPTFLSATFICATMHAAYPTSNMKGHAYMPTSNRKLKVAPAPAADKVGNASLEVGDEDEEDEEDEEESFGLLRKNKVKESAPSP